MNFEQNSNEQPNRVQMPVGGMERAASNAGVYFLAQILSWAVTILGVSIIPRRLGEASTGQLAVSGVVVSAVANCLMLGIESFLIAEIAVNRKDTPRILGATLGLRALMIVPMAACSCLILALIHASPTLWSLGLITIAVYALMYLSEPMRAVLTAWEDARAVALMDIVSISAPILAIPFLHFGNIIVVICTLFVVIGLFGYRVITINRAIRVDLRVDCELWRRIVRGGLPFLVNDVLAQGYLLSGTLVLRHFAGNAAVGETAQAGKLFGSCLFIPSVLATAYVPGLARMAQSLNGQFQLARRRLISFTMIIGLPMAAALFLVAEPLCRLLYGGRMFLSTPLILKIYAINLIPVYLNTILYRALAAEGQSGRWTRFLCLTVAINAGACVALIPLMGRLMNNPGAGIPAASLVAESATLIAALAILRIGIFSDGQAPRLVRALAAVGIMVAVMLVSGWMFFPITASLGVIAFGLACRLLHVMTPEDASRIKTAIAQKFRRKAPVLRLAD